MQQPNAKAARGERHTRSRLAPGAVTGIPCEAPAAATEDRSQKAGKKSFPHAWLAVAVLVAAGTLAYSNSFSGVFVFDDRSEILKNPALKELWPPGQAMFGGNTLPARPLPYYTFAINYALHGTNVWGFHAVNLAIHLAAGLVLLGIIRRTLRMPRLPPRYAAAADGLALAARAAVGGSSLANRVGNVIFTSGWNR